MNLWQRALVIVLFLGCLVWVIPVRSVMSADSKGDLRTAMQSIFQALTTVFPLSLEEEGFQNPANREKIEKGLLALAHHARTLKRHGTSVPPSFDFLQQALSRDAQLALDFFRDGYYAESQFVFQEVTDNCFLCHSQLPSSRSFALGQRFLDALPLAQLSPYQQVRTAVAVRQFDVALTACEALFQSRAVPAAQIDVMSFFEDYLRIVIRVHRDFPRAINTLESFLKRPDVPRYLRAHIATWIETLKTLQPDASQGHELPHVRTLIQQGQKRNRFLSDRQGLIYFALASSRLLRYVSTPPKSPSQLAEAYYLLGVTDSYIPRSSWLSETEFFLERAIRLNPASPIAKNAYGFLEEYVMLGLMGSISPGSPSDLHPQLAELRRLIDGI